MRSCPPCSSPDRVRYGEGADGDRVDYVSGANIAGFVKVADAMLAFGVV
jgi:glutamate dehydrogenase (NADP+)